MNVSSGAVVVNTITFKYCSEWQVWLFQSLRLFVCNDLGDISALKSVQTALKVKQKWLKEDWEFFKAQRKILEQQVLKNNPKAAMPHRLVLKPYGHHWTVKGRGGTK